MADDGSKRRRLRSGGACESCRRRKHRCDGLRPRCSNCQSRAARCQYLPSYYHLTPLDLHEQGEIPVFQPSARQATPTLGDPPLSRAGAPNAPPKQPSQPTALPTPSTQIADSQTDPAATTSPAVFPGGSSSTAFASSVGRYGSYANRQSSSDQSALVDSASNVWEASDPGPEARGIDSLPTVHLQDGPVALELPNQNLADELVDAYFEQVHPQWPFVHEPTFRSKYESMWTDGSLSAGGIYPYEDETWFALLNAVFAHGAKYITSKSRKDHPAEREMNDFVVRARCTILSHIHKSPTLEIAQALLILCHYLKATAALQDCRNLIGLLVHITTALGLDMRPPSNVSKQWNSVHKELRKRVWWGCFHIDHALSSELGHAAVSRGKGADVDLPAEVDDQYITTMSGTPRQPHGRPSYTSFLVHTCRMSQIQSDLLFELYLEPQRQPYHKDDQNTSSQNQLLEATIRFHNRLELWWKQVPPHLTQDESETGSGRNFHQWKQQRQSFKIRRYNIGLLLHRPAFCLFLRHSFNDEFLRSVAAASARQIVEYAHRALVTVFDWSQHRPKGGLHNNMHFIFTSMCVLIQFQAMDSDSRSYIDCPDHQTVGAVIQRGLDFLDTASRPNTLALKYLWIIQQISRRVSDPSGTLRATTNATSTVGGSSGRGEALDHSWGEHGSVLDTVDATDGLWTGLEHNGVDYAELDEILLGNNLGFTGSLNEWLAGMPGETMQS